MKKATGMKKRHAAEQIIWLSGQAEVELAQPSGCEMSLVPLTMRRALAMSCASAWPAELAPRSFRLVASRSATTWFGVYPADPLIAGVVRGVESPQQLLEIAMEVDGDAEHLTLDATVEAFHHAVGLWRIRSDMTVLGAQLGAGLLESR